MPDNQEKLLLRYPFRFVLCFAAGVGLGGLYSKSQVEQTASGREFYKIESERYKTENERIKTESEERGKKLVLLQRNMADERKALEPLQAELAQVQRDLQRSKEQDPLFDQAKRDLAAKTKQIDQLTAENGALKNQLTARSSQPRQVRVEEAARPILSILYKDGSRTFDTLRKTLELSDGTLRYHLMELQKSGLVSNKAMAYSPDVIYSAQLTQSGLKYARENGFD